MCSCLRVQKGLVSSIIKRRKRGIFAYRKKKEPACVGRKRTVGDQERNPGHLSTLSMGGSRESRSFSTNGKSWSPLLSKEERGGGGIDGGRGQGLILGKRGAVCYPWIGRY